MAPGKAKVEIASVGPDFQDRDHNIAIAMIKVLATHLAKQMSLALAADLG